jgi:hypothetical protein
MKTKTNNRHAPIMTLVLWATFVSITPVFSQSDPEEFKNYDVTEAFARLDALMSAVEESILYVAPSDITDDLQLAWKRLDLLARHTENDMQYQVPGIEPYLSAENDPAEINNENSEKHLLTDAKSLFILRRSE